jgi:hypothetical protein
VLHDRTITIDEIKILFRKATVMEKSYKLLKGHCGFDVRLYQDLVSHEQSSHHLEYWDLKREVEGSDNCNWTVRPSVASSKLSIVVARRSFGFSQVSHIVTAEVFKEVNCDLQLSIGLLITLRTGPLDCLNKKVPNFFVLHRLDNLSADFTQHEIPLLIMEGVVEA